MLFVPLVLALLLLRGFALELFRVEGISMEPTLKDGSTLFVNRLAYGVQLPFSDRYLLRWSQPRQSEILVFEAPDTGALSVKRVLAGPGAPFELIRNGIRFNGTTATLSVSANRLLDDCNRLADDEIFLIGDNRKASIDSRDYGPVRTEDVRGRVISLWQTRFGTGATDRK
ncbi:MAG: signal peptidase I [Spirochaetales bacterium]